MIEIMFEIDSPELSREMSRKDDLLYISHAKISEVIRALTMHSDCKAQKRVFVWAYEGSSNRRDSCCCVLKRKSSYIPLKPDKRHMRLYNPQIAQLYYPLSHTPKALLTIVGSSSLTHKKASHAFRRSGALGHERFAWSSSRAMNFPSGLSKGWFLSSPASQG
jgi:hypothetical protein